MSYEFVLLWQYRQAWGVFFGPPWIFGERVKKVELTFSGNASEVIRCGLTGWSRMFLRCYSLH